MMKILDLVKGCAHIGISGHENPDGDCVGSCCAMALYLRKMMPEAQVDIFLQQFDDALKRNIPGADTVMHEIPAAAEKYDAFIVLDSTPERTGRAKELFDGAALRINIDHHKTNKGGGDVNYIDGTASSASEMAYNVMDRGQIDANIAQALYVGIVTDTGVFQYSNTGESTMVAAGHLMTFGFDFSAIVREVFFERSQVSARVLGEAFIRAERILDGKCMFCILDREILGAHGACRLDLDGISEQLLLTEGTDCSVFVHEDEDGFWRCSMRSRQIVDVAHAASLLGGGGHLRAAGCTIRTDVPEAVTVLRGDIEKQLRSAGAL